MVSPVTGGSAGGFAGLGTEWVCFIAADGGLPVPFEGGGVLLGLADASLLCPKPLPFLFATPAPGGLLPVVLGVLFIGVDD
jgi:hypothetical protein